MADCLIIVRLLDNVGPAFPANELGFFTGSGAIGSLLLIVGIAYFARQQREIYVHPDHVTFVKVLSIRCPLSFVHLGATQVSISVAMFIVSNRRTQFSANRTEAESAVARLAEMDNFDLAIPRASVDGVRCTDHTVALVRRDNCPRRRYRRHLWRWLR